MTRELFINICKLPNKNIVAAMIGEPFKDVDNFHNEFIQALKSYSKVNKFDNVQLCAVGHLALLDKILFRKFAAYMKPQILRHNPHLLTAHKNRLQEIIAKEYSGYQKKKYNQ